MQGTTTDKAFFNNYLKASYAYDAPNNQASTWYKTVNETTASIFTFNDTSYFDNGSNGTYNVDYPDVINPVNGGIATLRYSNSSNDKSAIYYSGLFSGGTSNGKLVYFGFPFETLVSATKRNSMMTDILNFFFVSTVVTDISQHNQKIDVLIYPNPCSNLLSVISTDLIIKLELTDITGKLISERNTNSLNETLNVNELTEGVYFLKVQQEKGSILKKVSIVR